MGLGAGFALHKNWEVRLTASKVRLIRGSVMVNMLIEHALVEASKSLKTSKHAIESALLHGEVSPQQAYVILMQSIGGYSENNRSELLGMIFWVDVNGQLIAQSGEYSKQSLDLSDRYYFQNLRDHPDKRLSIGPLLMSRTIGQWVFHISVPIYDAQGKFAGVLVQQLHEQKIVNELENYINPSDFSQIFTHYNGNSVSFVYPPPLTSSIVSPQTKFDWRSHVNQLENIKNIDSWESQPTGDGDKTLVGFAKSPLYGLLTFATIPMNDLLVFFFWENVNILAYVMFGILLILVIFYQLHKMSIDLATAQDQALHDPLTQLHNRRALDENLPLLLREAMRSQHPMSVLFIDIDFFRRFNENHGHETGDLALIEVAHSLSLCCRRPMDLICRWGGEEFVAALPDTNAAAAAKIAEDMLQAVREIQLKLPNGRACEITVSVGSVSNILTVFNRLDDLVDMADKAMQQAKLTGRNRHVAFQVGLHQAFAAQSQPLALS